MRADLNIDFIGKSKIYYTISICLIAIGIVITLICGGFDLSIQFKGGAIVEYSYTGNIENEKAAAQNIAQKALPDAVINTRFDKIQGTNKKILVYEINTSVTPDQQAALYNSVKQQFSGNSIVKYHSQDVSPSMGSQFLQKSILAVVLASILIIIYIWIRFRSIGGLPAGLTAFISLLHDVLMGYVAFAILRIPLDDNFIAVTLTILGYSINDTIVVYDRVRENRRLYGTKLPFKDIVNKSINQSFARSINTSLVTFASIAVLAIFSVVYNLQSVTSFALPMMVGVATGCYSTICIAGPLWVSWETHKEKKALDEKQRLSLEKEQRKLKLEESRANKNKNSN
jgi:preprotein translocase subunit SecF